jgi:3-hydroxyacyl-CoA dehydrogenase/enoyl-CoA hydratase/3-hydroxybutyryl-CoA epimerase
MLTTGQTLSPQKAKSMNLIHQVVDPENLIAAAKGMIKGRAEAGRAMGREGLQAAGRTGLFAGRFQPLATGQCHPAPREHGNYPAARGDPEMRL